MLFPHEVVRTLRTVGSVGRCHAFVKTENDLEHIAASETWMSCGTTGVGGDPDGQEMGSVGGSKMFRVKRNPNKYVSEFR